MTTSYQGPAVILVDGEEHTANVDLSIHVERRNHIDSLKSWDGTADSDPMIDWFEADEVSIRMPDGREGRCFATAGNLGSGQIEIQGTGPAPFGDS